MNRVINVIKDNMFGHHGFYFGAASSLPRGHYAMRVRVEEKTSIIHQGDVKVKRKERNEERDGG